MLNKVLESILNNSDIPWNKIKNNNILITGASGLIGSMLIKTLIQANQSFNLNLKIIGIVRNKKKYQQLVKEFPFVTYYLHDLHDLKENLIIKEHIDHIIHAASITQSKKFVENPVDVIQTTVYGTDSLLNLAHTKMVKSFLYVSTMEIYGQIHQNHKITETTLCQSNLDEARNSYPISKQLAETLCFSYYHQYKLPIKIARLTLTFGPGISRDDNRVFAQFMKNAIKNEDIILHTEGKTKRDYLYISDAVSALLIILLNGENGEAYNVANSNTFITIKELAELVAQNETTKAIKINHDTSQPIKQRGYAPTVSINLDTSKLENLGWKAQKNLPEMIDETMLYLMEQQLHD